MHENEQESPINKPISGTSPQHPVFNTDEINELRKRLYNRGSDIVSTGRHSVPRQSANGSTNPPTPTTLPTPLSVTDVPTVPLYKSQEIVTEDIPVPNMIQKSKRNKVRKIIGIGGLLFFIVSMIVASIILFWGGNTISGENITITVAGSIAVGGGETYEYQVAIANQNTIPIQSATLIIEYPKGTQSATEEGKEISIERMTLDSIDAGQVINIPMKARMYGEENEEKEIKVWIEYRVAGSNAIFEKYAEPLKIKVITSPIVMTFNTVSKSASGQEVEIVLNVQSNSPTILNNILVKTYYPEGFDFTESIPDTISGEDTWKFDNFKPNEKKSIHIKGQITGYDTDVRKFSAVAGVSNEGNINTLASQLATADTEIAIESPFLDVRTIINGSPTETVVVNTTDTINVQIEYKNTLNTTISNGTVRVELSGNALNEFDIQTTAGYYDSAKNTITWDSEELTALKEILPGATIPISFNLAPSKDVGKTPEIKMTVSVTGQRTSESQVSQNLEGRLSRIIKVESSPILSGVTNYTEGPFTNTGPVPPVVEKVTQYTYLLSVKAGTSDLTGAEVVAVLPQSVSWLDLVTDNDTVTYNATTRTMKWSIGDIDANTEATVGVQVSFLPSVTQVGKVPTILETQRLKATDRFTGTTVRAESPALTTSLSTDPNDMNNTGRVLAK